MREIQNDLLFSYCLIYLLNGLIDVPGCHRQEKLFFCFVFYLFVFVYVCFKDCFKGNRLQTGVSLTQ